MGAPGEPNAAATRDSAGETRLAWRVGLLAYLVGAVTMVGMTFSPDPDHSDHGAMLILGGVLLASLGAFAAAGPRRWLVRAMPFWAVLIICALVAVAQPIGAAPFFLYWPVVFVAYFLGRAELVGVLLVLAVAYGAALAFFPAEGLALHYWLGGVLSVSAGSVVVAHLCDRVESLVAGLRESATTDPLTGLLNRRAFAELLDTELARSTRDGGTVTLALFDLDHFKQINDRFGHAQGDDALRRVAAILDSHARDEDLVARMGGEEFAVVFVGSDSLRARRGAERIAATVAETAIDEEVSLSMSAGLASTGSGIVSQDGLLRAADASLYEAKAAGRHRVAAQGGPISVTPLGGTQRFARRRGEEAVTPG